MPRRKHPTLYEFDNGLPGKWTEIGSIPLVRHFDGTWHEFTAMEEWLTKAMAISQAEFDELIREQDEYYAGEQAIKPGQ